MASISELFQVADALGQRRRQADPLSSGVDAFAGGLMKGIEASRQRAQEEEKRRQLFEMLGFDKNAQSGQVKTDAGKQKSMITSPRNDYKIDPTYDVVSGKASAIVRPKTSDEKFQEAASLYTSGAINENDFRSIVPTYQKEIDDIIFRTSQIVPSVGGDRVVSRSEPKIISKGDPKIINKGTTQQPGDIVPKGYDELGRPTGYEIVKPDIQEQKFDAEQKLVEEQKVKQSQLVRDSAQETLNTIAEIEKGINHFGISGRIPAGVTPWDYDKVDWQANLDKLTSNLIVDLMAQMKQASKTGATGFGQLSNKELELLKSASTALKKGMREEDAQKYLNQIKEKALKVYGRESLNTSEAQESKSPFNYLWE